MNQIGGKEERRRKIFGVGKYSVCGGKVKMAKEKENIFAPWRRPRAERETEGKSVGEGKSLDGQTHTPTDLLR